MKKGVFKILIFIAIIALISWIIVLINKPKVYEFTPDDSVSYNGWLKVDGKDIKNEKNEKVQLVGVSSHGIQWFYQFINNQNLKTLKRDWGANVIRLAIYVDVEGELVYNQNIDNLVIQLANTVIDNDMYVILDWHVLEEKDPNVYKAEAIEFFDKMSKIYRNTPNVIYEICNEPNGDDVTWDGQVKLYAEDVIKTIRNNSPKSLVIVGTPGWSKDFKDVIRTPLEEENIVYAYHFYAGDSETTIDDLNEIMDNNLPVLVTEWGVTNNSGNGEIYLDNSTKIIDFLNEKHIGWIAWSFSWKYESTAIIDYRYDLESDINDNLSETGKYIKKMMMKTKGK